MKILYATKNRAKFSTMKTALINLNDVELISLDDLEGKLSEVKEDGLTPLENAKIKALTYYEFFNIPVFSCDSGLYFKNIPERLQPGVFVRRPNGKELSDEEMIEYYSSLAKKYGDISAVYRNAICFVYDRDTVFASDEDNLSWNEFWITSKPHSKRVKGFPLDCLSVNKKGEYYYDINKNSEQIDTKKGFEIFFKKTLKTIEDSEKSKE